MQSAQQQELRLSDYLRLIQKRRRLVFGVMIVVLALVLVYSFMTPKIYQSKSTVQVQGQTGYVIRATPQLDDSSTTLTPTSLTELIGSAPYEDLASGLVVLAEGYHMDLTAYHSEDDMVRLLENELIVKPLPAYFGEMAIQASHGPLRSLQGFGFPTARNDRETLETLAVSNLPHRLSSVQKDEVYREAGALALLARRFNIDLFSMTIDQIGPAAEKIMDSDLVRTLKTQPLKGKSWGTYSPLERGALIQATYREVAKSNPDERDKQAKLEQYTTRELKETGMLSIAFDSPDQDRATQGADAMVAVIVWKSQYERKQEAQRYRQVTEQALYGLDGKGGIYGLLNKSDAKTRDVKKSLNLPDYQMVKEAQSKQLVQLQTDYQTAVAEKAGAAKRVQIYSAELAKIPKTIQSPTVSDNPTLSRLTTDLAAAQGELQAARAQFTDIHPRVQSALAKVTRLQAAYSEEMGNSPRSHEMRESPNELYAQFAASLSKAQAELVSAEAERKTTQAALVTAQAQLAQVPDKEYDLTGVSRQSFILSEDLKILEAKYREAQLNEATKMSRASVVELAMDPGKKIKPKKTLNVILGVLLGLFLGMGAAVLAETMDPKIHSRADLERILSGIPVLATVPTFLGDHPLVVPTQIRSAAAEAFRKLRSSIRFIGIEKPLRTLVVTSPGFSEGKSTLSANLAASMAQSGQRVILVDADLRRPSQHEIMGVDNGSGLSSLLLGEGRLESGLKRTDTEGLLVLPSGPIPPNPTELLDSEAMRRLMAELEKQADIVLFDTPPVGVVTDASVLGSMVEGTILVAGSGQTSQDPLVRACEALALAHARILGVVLNRADASHSDAGYHLYRNYEDNPGVNGHRKSVRKVKTKV